MRLLIHSIILGVCCAWLPSRVIKTNNVHSVHNVGKFVGNMEKNSIRKAGKLFAYSQGLTLDRSAIPRGFALVKETNNFAILFLSAIIVARLFPRKLKIPMPSMTFEDMERFLWPNWLQNIIETIKTPIIQFSMFIKLCVKVVIAKTIFIIASIFNFVNHTLDWNPPEELETTDWNVCVLDERENLSGGIIKYRFELPNPSATVPLNVGQEVRQQNSFHIFDRIQ